MTYGWTLFPGQPRSARVGRHAWARRSHVQRDAGTLSVRAHSWKTRQGGACRTSTLFRQRRTGGQPGVPKADLDRF